MTVYSGITDSIKQNYSGNRPNVSANLNICILDGYVQEHTPIIQQYGFHSLPINNLSVIFEGLQDLNSAVVLGYINPCRDLVHPKIEVGESVMYNSTDYSYIATLTGMLYKWFGADKKALNTKTIHGQNAVKLFIEIYAQMLEHIDEMNKDWIAIYNNHKHKYIPGDKPEVECVPTEQKASAYTPRAQFTHLKAQLDEGGGKHNFIDDWGKTFTDAGKGKF